MKLPQTPYESVMTSERSSAFGPIGDVVHVQGEQKLDRRKAVTPTPTVAEDGSWSYFLPTGLRQSIMTDQRRVLCGIGSTGRSSDVWWGLPKRQTDDFELLSQGVAEDHAMTLPSSSLAKPVG